MTKQHLLFPLLAISLILAACSNPSVPDATQGAVPTVLVPSPTEALPVDPAVIISEVLTGMDGNNNFEFIELSNPGVGKPFDLKGWSLWFKLADGDVGSQVFVWTEHTLIPPRGHYLLVYKDQDVGTRADAVYETAMIPQRGGLQLRRPDDSGADSISWGSGPTDFAEGDAAPAMKNGIALERMPGGSKGNWIDTGDNALDFAFSTPNPENTASPSVPQPEPGLALSVEAPHSVMPGDQFVYALSVTNQSSKSLEGVTFQLPIPLVVGLVQTPPEISVSDQDAFWGMAEIGDSHQVVLWDVGGMDAGASVSTKFTVTAPWTYMDVTAANYSVQVFDGASVAFGSPVHTSVEGGAVPVGVLIDLVGKDLVVEGIATMYTGGYYAGGGNVKFYLADETGGVQVWVPDGEGTVDISIGDKVQAAGNLQVYRGALELVVNELTDVAVLATSGESPAWILTAASIGQASNDPALTGKLIQIEGTVTRNEEFSFSYELDLIDESGQIITLYVDKQTLITVEAIEVGHQLRATGILETYDTRQQLYPRLQGDLERIYPPVLTLDLDAPNTVIPGDSLDVTLTATNYTPDPLTGLTITATMPIRGAEFVSASDNAAIKGRQIIWTIPELAGDGAAVDVGYKVKAVDDDGLLTFDKYSTSAQEWPEPVSGDPYLVFLGDTVPIWAIQGSGDRSPYTFGQAVTAGTVTGVFPDLGGFWIQEIVSDDDPNTSAGLFINTGEMDVSVDPGSTVQVSGVVRETYQQTQVLINGPGDVVLQSTGGPLPTAVELDPPPDEAESYDYFERLEGMLVQVDGGWIAVSPTSQYGEYVLVHPRHGIDRLWQGDSGMNGLAVMVDDGSSAVHLDRATLAYVVNTGDQISGLIGPLAYTFSRFKVEPVVQPKLDPITATLPSIPLTGTDAFSLMTWNVENLFDIIDPHPSSPERPSVSAYKISVAKVANTIVAAGAPTIVGLQEVENIDILEDIGGHAALAGFDYLPFLLEGTDSRYIDNGYLVRGDVARVVDVAQHIAPEGLTSRPPLRIEVEIQTDSRSVTVFVVNNHFTSMSGGESVTEPRRNAQAAWNGSVLNGILEANPGAYVAILGDFNSYEDSLPIDTLRESGLVHIYDLDPQAGWYSYIYQGASQTLDHILVTPNLFELLQRVDILHVNADFGPPIAGDESPLRKSDHDPVIATFTLP